MSYQLNSDSQAFGHELIHGGLRRAQIDQCQSHEILQL